MVIAPAKNGSIPFRSPPRVWASGEWGLAGTGHSYHCEKVKPASKPNFPTVSAPSAMRDYPHARNNERDTLLDYVNLARGMSVLDIQAAGGYLSDEVFRRLEGKVAAVCVEPNPELRKRLNPAFRTIDNPVEDFPEVADRSIDVALGLIGLHHSDSHRATIHEAFRVLKPGGELALCDVAQGSRLADWLNIFVQRNCPAGHTGNFPQAGMMTKLCAEAGFVDIVEEPRDVPWIFPGRQDIAVFFQGLFGLACDPGTIDRALDEYFIIHDRADGCVVDWQLLYCHARKPA